jgi:hypothetical protein
MAYSVLERPQGFTLSDNIHFYKVQETSLPSGTPCVFAIYLENAAFESEFYQFASVLDANHQTYIDVSEIVRNFSEQNLQFTDTLPMELKSFIRYQVSLIINTTTYSMGYVSVLYGRFTPAQKNVPIISSVRTYEQYMFTDTLGKRATLQPRIFGYYGHQTLVPFYFRNQTADSLDVFTQYYLGADLVVVAPPAPIGITTSSGVANVLIPLPDTVEYDRVYVTLVDADNSVTETVLVYAMRNNLPSYSRTFVWINAMGGISMLQTLGEESQQAETKDSRFISEYSTKNYSNPHKSNLVVYNIQRGINYETHTGPLMREVYETLPDVLSNKYVWLLENDKLVAIQIDGLELDPIKTSETNYFSKIKWHYILEA